MPLTNCRNKITPKVILAEYLYINGQAAQYNYCCSSFIFAKHSLQYTGRSSRGAKGILATPPQAAQTASCISRGARLAFLRLSRHSLQRCGSFTNPLDSKNSCSPAVNTNSAPQSLHTSVLSSNIFSTSLDCICFCPGRNRTDIFANNALLI